MAPPVQVHVQGDERLAATMKAAAKAVADMSGTSREAAELLAVSARGRAPVDTGALSQSITAEATHEGAQVSSDLVYAGVQEWGWRARGIPAQPFMVPALDEHTERIADLYERAADAAIDKVKGA